MKKVIIILSVSLVFTLIGLFLVGIIQDDKEGMLFISTTPGSGTTISEGQEVELKFWYVIWGYSRQVNYHISYGCSTGEGFPYWQAGGDIQLPDLFGTLSVKVNLSRFYQLDLDSIKYPYELKAYLNYTLKGQQHGAHEVDASNKLYFRLDKHEKHRSTKSTIDSILDFIRN